jgi:plasmid stability protein
MGVLNLRGFPDDLQDALRIAAAKRKTSIKALMVTAAREWLEREGELSKTPRKKAKG